VGRAAGGVGAQVPAGGTLAAIAAEKAAIIRSGVAVSAAPPPPTGGQRTPWAAALPEGPRLVDYIRRQAPAFAAVLPTSFIADLAARDLARYGATSYADADPVGLPTVTW